MKRITVVLAILSLICTAAAAQDNFRRGWQLDLGAGASYTFGSDPDKWSDPLSYPALSVGAIYNISPAWGVRGVLSGYKASAGIAAGQYSWYQGQLGVDAILNLRGIGGWQPGRTFRPYLFAGLGINRRTTNQDAIDMIAAFPEDHLIWKRPVDAFAGRIGIGGAWKIGKTSSFIAEVVDNVLPDEFNSYPGKDLWPGDRFRLALDNHLSAIVGFRFDLGVKKAEQKAAAEAAAEQAAAAAAAARAARLAAERRAAEQKAAEEAANAVKEQPAAGETSKHVCCRFHVTDSFGDALADPGRRIFFKKGSDAIQEPEQAKIDALAQELGNMKCCHISVIGYADATTGTVGGNLVLSKHRAVAVAQALKAAGIPEDRIQVSCKGDFEQVEGTPEDNRMALVVVDCLSKCE